MISKLGDPSQFPEGLYGFPGLYLQVRSGVSRLPKSSSSIQPSVFSKQLPKSQWTCAVLICSTSLLPLWQECLHYPSHPQPPPQRAQSRREHLKKVRSARSSLSSNFNLEPTQRKNPNQTQLVWGCPSSSSSLELTRPCATPAFPT